MNGQGPVDLSALEELNRQQERQVAMMPTKAETLRATAVQLACGVVASGHWRRGVDDVREGATPNDVVVLAERITRYIVSGEVKVS
jgi:hypothetical protein